MVRIYYGFEDGGFSPEDWNNSFIEVNGGNSVALGDFNATITGLIAGERYFFRAFAQSADGIDWSSGDPNVKAGLLGYWRMDETNGTKLFDSLSPFHDAELSVLDINASRVPGYLGRGLFFTGSPDFVNLDLNSTDFLEKSFDGRSVSLWIKPDQGFYTGPKVTKYESLAGYYAFDTQSGTKVSDLSVNEAKAELINGTGLASGQYGQSLSFDGVNDQLVVPTPRYGSFKSDSYTISMWINQINQFRYLHRGRLHAHGYLRGLIILTIQILKPCLPSKWFKLSYKWSGKSGLDFNNNSDYGMPVLVH